LREAGRPAVRTYRKIATEARGARREAVTTYSFLALSSFLHDGAAKLSNERLDIGTPVI
jgi:hypothetical protein